MARDLARQGEERQRLLQRHVLGFEAARQRGALRLLAFALLYVLAEPAVAERDLLARIRVLPEHPYARPVALAALGAALGGAGLFAIAGSKPSLSFAWALLLSLLLQGAGLGLFQVAYTEIVMRTLPRADRGLAGGLSMLTRTLGIVGGATLLSLALHGFESAALARGEGAEASFLTAFRATFRLAGLLSTAAAALIFLKKRES
jgi:MFS family permease